jgi:hypothetical protein
MYKFIHHTNLYLNLNVLTITCLANELFYVCIYETSFGYIKQYFISLENGNEMFIEDC